MTSEFKPGQAVRVDAKFVRVSPVNPDAIAVYFSFGDSGFSMFLDASAVHLAPGDGERGYRALTLLRELVIGEEFAGDEYPERFRKFVSEICDLARPLIVEEENTNGDNE